ncbi:SpoVR family protein [Klebsiella pneumoniae]|uniref:SpoVR family protein n=1 Tax=Klebsiella pneumoniae TaxID=573 RepID=A0A377U022_KLEPN|nr:SpoVR family protein [Klebsiella pneumoniae]
MNEGWATFWHYTILNHLYDEGKVTERFMLEFLHSHTNVVFQPPYNSPWYSGLTPTRWASPCSRTSSASVSRPRKRIKYWFPDIAGSDWLETLHFAMRDFKDEKLYQSVSCRRRSCAISASLPCSTTITTIIWRSRRFTTKRVIARSAISSPAQYNLSNLEPNIQVWNVDLRGDRSLTLRYVPHNRVPLDKGRREVLKHVASSVGVRCAAGAAERRRQH